MPSTDWIRNLAGASFENGQWILEDPENSKRKAESELADFIMTLSRDLDQNIHTYNIHNRDGKEMRKIEIRQGGDTHPSGVILLLGSAQVRLEKVGMNLVQKNIYLKNFQELQRSRRTYQPRFDQMGGLLWQVDSNSTVTSDQLVKIILTDLCFINQSTCRRESYE